MNVRVGLDAQSGLVYPMRMTTADASDNAVHAQLLHVEGQVLGGDSACGTIDLKRHCRRQAGIVHLINDKAARPISLSGKPVTLRFLSRFGMAGLSTPCLRGSGPRSTFRQSLF